MSNRIEITDFTAPELDVYARIPEVQLLRFYEPKPGLFIAESPKVIQRAANAGYQPVSFLVQHKDLEKEGKELLQKFPGIPVYTADYEVLVKLTGFALTRGMLCAMTRRDLPSVEDICKNARALLLDGESIVGAYKTVRDQVLHMDAVLLTPGCCDPLYRRATRVSMGSVFQIPWTYFHKKVSWPKAGMEQLRSLGFKTVAMALRNDSISIDAPALQAEEKLAIILGAEGDGLVDATITGCDYTVKIPMSHEVDSLNVAAASAVAFWELGKR